MGFEPFVFRQDGVLGGIRSGVAEDGVVDAVNQFSLRPLAREEFAVFSLDLCNNRIDKHFSRFPEEELEKINGMTPGRPLMERHDLRGTLPRGTFFRSDLARDEAMVSVRPEVYVLRTQENADFILNIEGGVYRETSIGFSFKMPECSICRKDLRACAHEPGKTYSDQQCHFTMRDVIEVIEGSVVSSGSQGTGFVQQRGVLSPQEALALARRDFHRPIELASDAFWAAE